LPPSLEPQSVLCGPTQSVERISDGKSVSSGCRQRGRLSLGRAACSRGSGTRSATGARNVDWPVEGNREPRLEVEAVELIDQVDVGTVGRARPTVGFRNATLSPVSWRASETVKRLLWNGPTCEALRSNRAWMRVVSLTRNSSKYKVRTLHPNTRLCYFREAQS
jgi:hypothetical protein